MQRRNMPFSPIECALTINHALHTNPPLILILQLLNYTGHAGNTQAAAGDTIRCMTDVKKAH